VEQATTSGGPPPTAARKRIPATMAKYFFDDFEAKKIVSCELMIIKQCSYQFHRRRMR
jgi:hypothetical protein